MSLDLVIFRKPSKESGHCNDGNDSSRTSCFSVLYLYDASWSSVNDSPFYISLHDLQHASRSGRTSIFQPERPMEWSKVRKWIENVILRPFPSYDSAPHSLVAGAPCLEEW